MQSYIIDGNTDAVCYELINLLFVSRLILLLLGAPVRTSGDPYSDASSPNVNGEARNIESNPYR